MKQIDRAWPFWPVLGVIAGVAYTIIPSVTGSALLSFSVGLTSVLLTFVGVWRNRPTNPYGWWIFGVGLIVWVAGDLTYALNQVNLGYQPYPSWADCLYLSAYPFMLAGLFMLTRERRRARLTGLIDTAIVATGLGLVYWIFVIGPVLADAATPPLTRFVTAAYPTASVLMFAVISPLFLQAKRRTPSAWLLTLGALMTLASNVVYSLVASPPGWLYACIYAAFLFTYCCFAGAALHPSGKHAAAFDGSDHFGRGRFVLLGAATLLVPSMLFIEGTLAPTAVDWLAIGIGSGLLFLLVLTRMSSFVTKVQAQSKQLEDLAMKDELTGMANRRRFEQRLEEVLDGNRTPMVLMLDLNGFKEVNDRFGHAVGDRLLIEVARRLVAATREGDLVARMGGDEFAVLVPSPGGADVGRIAERLLSALRRPVEAEGHELLVSASMGSADGSGTVDSWEVMRRADVAMYTAKAIGGGHHQRWHEDMDAKASERVRLGVEMRAALDEGQFHLAYQPIVALPSGKIVSVEALLRWQHPDRGFVSPADFIPVAEQNGLIVELGLWILRTACAQAVAWRRELGDAAPERVGVNVSARQLAEPDFSRLVAGVLASSGLGAHHLTVEVTETAVFGGGQAAQAVKDLHELGVKIALDDFGTGHSSLGLLQTIPVDILKVDKSFVDNITMAGRHAVIATALIQVAGGLGLSAVAEGVETAEQAEELHRLGYRYAQGYHFGRPVPRPDFEASAGIEAPAGAKAEV